MLFTTNSKTSFLCTGHLIGPRSPSNQHEIVLSLRSYVGIRIVSDKLLRAPYELDLGLKRRRDILVKLELGSYGVHSNRVSDRDVARIILFVRVRISKMLLSITAASSPGRLLAKLGYYLTSLVQGALRLQRRRQHRTGANTTRWSHQLLVVLPTPFLFEERANDTYYHKSRIL